MVVSILFSSLSDRDRERTAGPMKGAAAKIAMATPRCLLANISAITPPAFVSGLLPKAPAMNRSTTSVPMFLEPAPPALKAVKAPYVVTNSN